MSGRLHDEASAYLRQHAGNPVDWWPFGAEAFGEAARRDVPVFVSVGYAACHWCHVMAHESFEDPAVADYLNANFVSIKVDREERPDVDDVYMAATQAISGEGGWPMSVFTLPDGRAFHAGTYYPPRPLPGRPSFRQVLEAVVQAWRENREQVRESASRLAAGLSAQQQGSRDLIGNLAAAEHSGAVTAEMLTEAVHVLERQEDRKFGGFGPAPKFPPSPLLPFLLGHAVTDAPTARTARDIAGRTLDAMAGSALFDQLDGGFARYSVNREWSVPHFEKMLYDNAQLLRSYARWSAMAPGMDSKTSAADVASATADWLLRDLRVAGGAFASSLDADTLVDGIPEEGAAYLWSRVELLELLDEHDGAWVADLMNVTEPGSVTPHGSPLHPGRLLTSEERRRWNSIRPRLLEARRRRPQPARDAKVVAGWNGLAVAALAEAATLLERPDLLGAALDAGNYLTAVHGSGGDLARVSFDGAARGIGGLLEDYAYCAEGYFALYAATGDPRWFREAEALVHSAVARFVVDGSLQDSLGESEQVLNAQGGRPGAEPLDNATPAGATSLAGVLLTCSAYSNATELRDLAERLLAHVGYLAGRAPRVAGQGLAAAQAALLGPVELAIVGRDAERVREWAAAALRWGIPGLVIAWTVTDNVGQDGASVPLLDGRSAAPDGGTLAYVCRNMVCQRPAGSLAELEEQLRSSGLHTTQP